MRFQLRKFLKHCSPEAERLCQGKYLFYMCLVFNPFSIASVTGKQAPRLNRPLVWPLILVHLHYVFFFFFHFPWENHFKHLHSCLPKDAECTRGSSCILGLSNDYVVGSRDMCSSAVSLWPYTHSSPKGIKMILNRCSWDTVRPSLRALHPSGQNTLIPEIWIRSPPSPKQEDRKGKSWDLVERYY